MMGSRQPRKRRLCQRDHQSLAALCSLCPVGGLSGRARNVLPEPSLISHPSHQAFKSNAASHGCSDLCLEGISFKRASTNVFLSCEKILMNYPTKFKGKQCNILADCLSSRLVKC